MKSILEEMYYGKKFDSEHIPFSAVEQENLKKKLECDKIFAEGLPQEERERFRRYVNDIGDLYAVDIMRAYVEGVKIGILIGIEAAGIFDDA